ncbi:hypothetical protein AWENTII_003240 [Aspergillus wentii]
MKNPDGKKAPVTFIDDLLEFCVETSRYDELEGLLQECHCPIKKTSVNSRTKVFWKWNEDEGTTPQKLLVTLRPPDGDSRWEYILRTPLTKRGMWEVVAHPGRHLFWEDSRMYCKTWDSAIMKRVQVGDSGRNQPFAIILHPDRIEYQKAEHQQRLNGSEMKAVLLRKRESAALGSLLYDREREREEHETFTGSYKVWIFPQDTTKPKRQLTSKYGLFCREDFYRLIKLDTDQKEFMLIRFPWSRARQLSFNCYSLESRFYGLSHIREDLKTLFDTLWHGPNEMTSGSNISYLRCIQKPFLAKKEKYTIREIDDCLVQVHVPFVPWEDFEASSSYQAGLTFLDYMASLRNGIGPRQHDMDRLALLCRDFRQGESPKLDVSDTLHQAEVRAGFLGCIPSGKALVGATELLGCNNLVSSRWRDWQNFPLASPPESHIAFGSGQIIPCLGYITANWAFEEAVEHQWHIQLLVVDAVFVDDMGNPCNFILSNASLSLAKSQVLTSPKLRFFSAAVSPYLFRYAPFHRFRLKFASVTWRKFENQEYSDKEIRQWEETNRREKWDRGYKKRLHACELQANHADAVDALRAEYDQEQANRRDWDSKNQVQDVTLASISGLSSTPVISQSKTEQCSRSVKPKSALKRLFGRVSK